MGKEDKELVFVDVLVRSFVCVFLFEHVNGIILRHDTLLIVEALP